MSNYSNLFSYARTPRYRFSTEELAHLVAANLRKALEDNLNDGKAFLEIFHYAACNKRGDDLRKIMHEAPDVLNAVHEYMDSPDAQIDRYQRVAVKFCEAYGQKDKVAVLKTANDYYWILGERWLSKVQTYFKHETFDLAYFEEALEWAAGVVAESLKE